MILIPALNLNFTFVTFSFFFVWLQVIQVLSHSQAWDLLEIVHTRQHSHFEEGWRYKSGFKHTDEVVCSPNLIWGMLHEIFRGENWICILLQHFSQRKPEEKKKEREQKRERSHSCSNVKEQAIILLMGYANAVVCQQCILVWQIFKSETCKPHIQTLEMHLRRTL